MKKNIKTMKDPVSEEVVHPVTVADAVYMDNGSRLEDNIRYCRNKAFEVGDLSRLLTNNKHTLVSAINELYTKKSNSQFGVRFVGSETQGVRIGDAYNLHASTQITEGEEVINDFDEIYPWSEMRRCVINEFGEIVAYEGEPGFFTNGLMGDVFVEIPKFYQKCYKDDVNNYIEYWISSIKEDGFWLNPAFKDGDTELDHIYIGCYEGTYDNKALYSRSGFAIAGNKSIDEFRELARVKGKGFKLCDYLERNLIEYLFMIEYATRNSQDIFKGNCEASAYMTGMGDVYTHPSETTHDSYTSPFRYRYMENIYGNVWEMLDGITIFNGYPLITTNIDLYGKYDEYTKINHRIAENSASFFIDDRIYDVNIPYINLPINNEQLVATNNTYFADNCNVTIDESNNKLVMVGGRTNYGSVLELGLMMTNATNSLDNTSSVSTVRLCYKPVKRD